MKLSSQLFDGLVNRRTSPYAAKLVGSITPGQSIFLASGERCRVLGKTTTAGGSRFRLERKHGEVLVTASELAALCPVPSVVRRLASVVHSILAFDSSLGTYVTAAIDEAALPQDSSMDWGKWLNAVYRPALIRLTQDLTLIDEAIREVLVHELYEKRVLENNFNPDHSSLAGKDLAHKVSAYLSFLFKQNVPFAVRFVKRTLGPGMDGRHGLMLALPLTRNDEFGKPIENYDGITYPDAKTEDGEDERLGEDEVLGFLEAFKQWYSTRLRDNTIEAMDFVCDKIGQGMDRTDIREVALSPSSPLHGRNGESYNVESWKAFMQNWAHMLMTFADSKNSLYADTGVAKAVVNRAAITGRKTRAAGLRMAMEDTGQSPYAPYPQPAQ